MKSIASAPGKVILFGEHFVVHGLKAILCSIDKRIKVTTEVIEDDEIIIISNMGKIQIDLKNQNQETKSAFKPFLHIAKKMMKEFNHKKGLQITIESNIPSGVGLGSSSACCVAAAASISGIFTKLSREKILELAIEAERTVFKNVSGADTTICTYGGIIEYDRESGFKKLDLNSNLNLVIANSMQTHSTNKVVSKVQKFKEENSELFLKLCEKESELIKNVHQALSDNDYELLGKSMLENQNLLETIGVSNEKLSSMIEIANKTSYGSKLTGAGGGGCIISLTDENKIEETIKNLKDMKIDCFSTKIDSKGLDTF